MIDTKSITQRLRLALLRAGGAALDDGHKAEPPQPQTGPVADSDSLAEGRSQPIFHPRRVRTPTGTDLS